MINDPYFQNLVTLFTQHADPVKAKPMQAYMRDQFPYLGIKTPERKALFKQFITEHRLPSLEQVEPLVLTLWHMPEREYQYVAMEFIAKFKKKMPADAVPLMETLITTKSWWDTIDTIAARIVGPLFQKYPEAKAHYLPIWRQSDDFWLRRTALLHQLGYKTDTDFGLLCELINENLGSTEFFINKAIGWALREYSKTDGTAVIHFVHNSNLVPLSHREALKWLKNKGLYVDPNVS
ncbi:MAG: DNA alkylation repair protein [Chloroflexi bacterium]|nr:DNA alkylation repair protein [Chloroflexota bacterium]